MPKPDPKRQPESAWLGALFIWIAGYVDAIGYITLFHVYAANMSGNSVSLAINSAQTDWRLAFAHACPILAFFPGLIAGASIVKACKMARFRTALLPSMIFEAGILILFVRGAHHYGFDDLSKPAVYNSIYVMAIGLLAFAMGVQNGALREISGLKSIHTYVTGTLLSAADECTTFFFWLIRRLTHRPKSRWRRLSRYIHRQPELRVGCYSLLLWCLYVCGGIAGALLLLHLGIASMFVAVIALLITGLFDLFLPLAHYPERSRASSRRRSES
ncbi:MAG TPA: YoaK family protein [Tepidisphaeraceae bacterium]|jgi:uncharacterized membrane protein YoaK (UPF0700 family)